MVQIEFDPAVITYDDLLQIFFQTHDPTTLNRRATISARNTVRSSTTTIPPQRTRRWKRSESSTAAGAFPAPIVTLVEPAVAFYPAEDYHQDYFAAHPDAGLLRLGDPTQDRQVPQEVPRFPPTLNSCRKGVGKWPTFVQLTSTRRSVPSPRV